MPMDRSEVVAIVDREMPDLVSRLGLDRWDIRVEYGHIDDDGGPMSGRCRRAHDYDRAWIDLDPEMMDDEADLLRTLRHELFHIVHSPFDLYTQAVDEADLPKPMNAVLDRVWRHACERTVANLERIYKGLTAPRPPTED